VYPIRTFREEDRPAVEAMGVAIIDWWNQHACLHRVAGDPVVGHLQIVDRGSTPLRRPGRMEMRRTVAPEHRLRGVGSRLYEDALAFAREREAQSIRASYLEYTDHEPGFFFLEIRGFVELQRYWPSRLNVAGCDLTPFEDRERRLAAEGVRFVIYPTAKAGGHFYPPHGTCGTHCVRVVGRITLRCQRSPSEGGRPVEAGLAVGTLTSEGSFLPISPCDKHELLTGAAGAFVTHGGSTQDHVRLLKEPFPCSISSVQRKAGSRFLPGLKLLGFRATIHLTYAQAGDTPENRRKLYTLEMEARTDIPVLDTEGFEPEPFEVWSEDLERKELAAIELAEAEGEWVGMCLGTTWGFTGVRQGYRGRGVATALKVRAIRAARERGVQVLETENAARNAPMLAINRKLGYEFGTPEVEWVRWLR
jgi:GNAT superfamily N-acetyltransferase